MKKSALYTKGGDTGETSLVDGSRTSKASDRISLYGNVDELNSHVGFLLSLIQEENLKFPLVEKLLLETQKNLFNLGSRLACDPKLWDKYKLPIIDKSIVGYLENGIDELDVKLPKMKNFILPGGGRAAAYSHVTRTFCRRVEREMVSFTQLNNAIPESSIEFLNRLSDFIFVVGRYINNEQNVEETIWSATTS